MPGKGWVHLSLENNQPSLDLPLSTNSYTGPCSIRNPHRSENQYNSNAKREMTGCDNDSKRYLIVNDQWYVRHNVESERLPEQNLQARRGIKMSPRYSTTNKGFVT